MIILSNQRAPKTIALILLVLGIAGPGKSQPPLPQHTFTVEATQPVSFGKFCITGSGTISVNEQGAVSTTGGVVRVNSSTTHPAVFNLKLCPGRTIQITKGGTTQLTCNQNGATLDMTIGNTYPSGQFITSNDCNFIHQITVGATLIVPANAPPGNYSGPFSLTFSQE